jgi:tyrosine-protein kinase Etk/Wzc
MDQTENSTPRQAPLQGNAADDEIDLLALLGTLIDNRWTIIASTFVAAVMAVAVAVLSTPIYQAGAMLQVEEKAASLPGLEDLSEAFGSESSTQAELEILKSRSVVGTAVDNLGLTTNASPVYFPVIGGYLARGFAPSSEQPLASAFLGLGSYAWGGESIGVDRFEVPRDGPSELTLTVGESGAYIVASESGGEWPGAVGETLVGDGFELFISELAARPETQFTITSSSLFKVTQAVQGELSVSEVGRQSGIIRISYRSADADEAEAIVDEIARVYVDQNIRRLSAEAENSLNFMREQIPFIQRDLDRAEAAFNSYASENQSIDVSAENQAVLRQLVELDTRIQELELERVELNRRFTQSHPNVLAAEEQYRQLLSERARFNRRIEALPDTQQQLVSLRRDVEVASGMYELLLYKAQEMEVARASTVGNVRIIDTAIVDRSAPVAPRKPLIAVLGTLLGGLAGVVIVLVRRAVYRGVESADAIEQAGLPVFASVPFSAEQERWDLALNDGKRAHKGRKNLRVLAYEEPTDLAVEMLRNLRTSLYFNLAEASNKAVMITGPSPGVGKSFIAVNLGHICAQAGQRVLLIDADMRRGYLHRYSGTGNKAGLSDYLAGRLPLDECIAVSADENLHVMTRGKTPPNPSELLHHERLDELIAVASERYDMILFDTPPMLAVTDAALIGSKVGNTLLVCRFDKTSRREIEHASERLARDGAKVTGAVLNGVEKRLSNYYGYGGYYGYGYGYSYKSRD